MPKVSKNKQLSFFIDGETVVDDNCKKIEKTMRDNAKKIQTHYDTGVCVYKLIDSQLGFCQIAHLMTDGIKITPNISRCGTTECPYYISRTEV